MHSPLAQRLPPAVQTQLSAFWRRRRTLLAVAWVVAVLGWAAVMLMPDKYTSMTRIYVETESLLTPLLRNIAVETDLQKQLEVMQRTLLNRNNLAQVARATDLDLGAHNEAEMDALYARLQKAIDVKAEGRNLFSVSYRDRDPAMAKKVVETLLTIFVETNLGQNRSSMENARSFIEKQIAEYEEKLKNAETRLAEYKGRNAEVLMATGANFSQRLETARTEKANAKIRLDEVTIARDQLRAHLAATPQFLDVETAPQVVVSNGAMAANTTKGRIRQLEAELQQLRLRYTDQHPDVTAAERALVLLKEQAAGERGEDGAVGGSRSRVPNAVYEQIKLRLVQAEADAATANSRYQLAVETHDRIAAMAEVAPRIETELAELNRENGVLRAKYEDLLNRRESARISQAVEVSGDKVQFRVVEPPHVPAVPNWPNRPLFLTIVLVAALGAGGAVVFLLGRLDDTVSSADSVESLFGIRVLGTVPKVENAARTLERRRSLRRFGFASASLFAAYAGVMVLSTQGDKVAETVAKSGAGALVEKVHDYAR